MMFILTVAGKEREGAYSVQDAYGNQILYLFEQEDDAERYGGLLEAEDYPPMSVVQVEDELAIETCEVYNYRYVVISNDDFVIPPRDDTIQADTMA